MNYHALGVDRLIWWGLIIVVVVLALGYTIMLLDFVLSGKVSQYIVVPKIKTIVIEEEIVDEEDLSKPKKAEQTKVPTTKKAHSANKKARHTK